MENIRGQLSDVKEALKKLGPKDSEVTPVPPQPRKKIEALEKKHKFALPPALKAYYLETNGHFIFWSLPAGGVAGASSVLSINSFFTNRTTAFRDGKVEDHAPYYSKDLDEGQRKFLDEEFFVFERAFADTFVLVSRKESGDDAALYLLEHPFTLTRLGLGFEEYLTALFENRALLNWQQQFKQGGKDAALAARLKADLKAIQSQAKAPKAGAAPYRERLDELLNRLRSNPKLDAIQFDNRAAPPPFNVFRKIEQTFKSELPAEFVRFYTEINGFTLYWQTKPDVTPAASGVIDLPPLEHSFGGYSYTLAVDWDDYVTYGLLWDDERRESFPDEFRALQNKRVFDNHIGRNRILMEPRGGEVKFFYYIDGGVEAMNVGFDELIDTLFDTAGAEAYPELLRPAGKMSKADERRARAFLDELTEKIKIVNPAFARR